LAWIGGNRGEGRQWRNRLAGALELPKDVIIGLPKVTVIGYLQVTVENHRGIIEFTPERVRVAAGEGAVEIRGQGLTLRSILADEIILDGRIETVTFSF
jgi:sporulation protein YqfC